jgi:hypothetical protein
MKKTAVRSSSNLDKALENDVSPYWYTAIHSGKPYEEQAGTNPWNQDSADTEKTVYLADDCVITLRPARFGLTSESSADFEKDQYFIEITNQDGSTIFSSNKVYPWDKALELSTYFKGLSFTAATRVWGVKKL